mgnify:CR=1 FL=1
MPKTLSYCDTTIELLHATPYPAEVVGLALSITVSADDAADIKPVTQKKAKFLIDAEHTSLFEHVVYTFLIQNMSRSLLAQITRQRTASPTSGSQHYQDYSGYPCVVHPDLQNNLDVEYALSVSTSIYAKLIGSGTPREEARQVLPNASGVNYLWTIDARNLMFFLRQRCCNRNVAEMRWFADRVRATVMPHFPELWQNVGPQCFMDKCKQGFMQCREKTWRPSDE